jgi:hypothetical protein
LRVRIADWKNDAVAFHVEICELHSTLELLTGSYIRLTGETYRNSFDSRKNI